MFYSCTIGSSQKNVELAEAKVYMFDHCVVKRGQQALNEDWH
jgi:hypothetical protein